MNLPRTLFVMKLVPLLLVSTTKAHSRVYLLTFGINDISKVSELVLRISMSSWWNTCLFYKHTNKRLTYPSALRNHRV